MLIYLAIFLDDDLRRPLYTDPEPSELDPELWERIGELVVDLQDGEEAAEGCEELGDQLLGWKHVGRNSLTFLAVVEDVEETDLKRYLKELSGHYFDEVDDVRNPERDGVEDVVVDVIPPWDD